MDYLNLVTAVIAKRVHVPLEQIGANSELASFAVDSFTLIEFLIDLQERHHIHLVADDLRGLRTVGDLAQLLQRRIEARAARSSDRAGTQRIHA